MSKPIAIGNRRAPDPLQEIMDAEVRLPKAGEFVRECRHSHTGFAIWHNEDGRQCCTCLPAPKPNLLQPKK